MVLLKLDFFTGFQKSSVVFFVGWDYCSSSRSCCRPAGCCCPPSQWPLLGEPPCAGAFLFRGPRNCRQEEIQLHKCPVKGIIVPLDLRAVLLVLVLLVASSSKSLVKVFLPLSCWPDQRSFSVSCRTGFGLSRIGKKSEILIYMFLCFKHKGMLCQ